MKHFLIFALFLCALPAMATTYFASQSGGSANCGNDGTQTTIAVASLSGTQWAADNTIKLCGAITSALAAQGSGASGHVITLVFEVGAKISRGACGSTGCLNLAGRSYIVVDGGSDGIIQATNSGTGLGNADSNGVYCRSGCSHVEVKNLTINGMYVHSGASDNPGNNYYAIWLDGTNNLIHNNTIKDALAGIKVEAGSSGNQFYNNTIHNANWGIFESAAHSVNSITNELIYGNEIYDFANWDTTADTFHHDGIFLSGNSATTDLTHVDVYNNYLHGTSSSAVTCAGAPGNGSCMTAYIFINTDSNVRVFNNLLVANNGDTGPNNGWILMFVDDHDSLLNNTVIGGSEASSPTAANCVVLNTGTNYTFENNVLSHCNNLLWSTGSSTFTTLDYNTYQATTLSWRISGTFYSTIAAWRTGSGGDAHGQAQNTSLNLGVNYMPLSGSSVIGAATNLTSLSISALDIGPPATFGATTNCGTGCISRPAVGVWDAGAYPFQASPSPIVSTLFDAGFNQAGSPWCPKDGNNVAAQVYGYRIWDDGQKWGQIQTTNTAPNFTGLDNAINTRAGGNNTQSGENIPIGAPCPGTPLAFIYVFGDTPQWASAGAIAANNCASPSTQFSCTKPASLNNDGTGTDVEYATIAADIINRYKGYVGTRYYEIWNEADSPNFWCWNDNTACGGSGSANNPALHANVPSLNNLVRMAWDLKNIAHCLDPSAKILSPSFHVGTALTWFHNYNITSISAPAGVSGVNGVPVGCSWSAATVTGKQTYDYVNVHARGTGAAFPATAGNWNPAAMITAYDNTVTEIANDSLPNPTVIFNDEYGYNSTTEGGGNTDGYSAYVAQTSTFCAALGFTQCYWYQWDTASIGLSGNLQGTAWDTVAGWLTGATITSGPTLVGNLYEVGLTKGGITELIVWDTTKYSQPCCVAPANQTFSSLYTQFTDLTGTVTPMSGGVAPVGWKPILLQQSPVACTSTSVNPPPTIAPFSGFTGAGTLVLNPEPSGCFHKPILRVTDGTTGTAACIAHGTSCAGKANRSWFVGSGSDGQDSAVSTDDAQFVSTDSGGGWAIFNNDPVNLTPPTIRYYTASDHLSWFSMPTYSHTTAKKVYSFSNSAGTANGTVLSSYDTSTTFPTLPPRTIIKDFATPPNGVPASAVFTTDAVSISADDTMQGTGFSITGGQNTGTLIAVNRAGFGLSVWNTATSTITGDYGGTGAAVCVNCPGGPVDPGHHTIHNVKFSGDFTWAIDAVATCLTTCFNSTSPYFWQVGTTNVYTFCPPHCSGHWVAGFTGFTNTYSTPFWSFKPFATPLVDTVYPSSYCAGVTGTFDNHAFWWNNTGADQEPFFTSTTAGMHNPVYTFCTSAEIISLFAPSNVAQSGNITRYAHSYAAATAEFAVQNQIATISQGKTGGLFVLMTSPMANSSTFIGQLGDTSGGFPCTVQANCRGDIFLVQIAPPIPSSTLTVTITPNGSGTVASTPSGIACPPTCTASFSPATSISLAETPTGGFNFVSWGGACTGSGACNITMGSSPLSVTATFAPPATNTLTVTITPPGGGSVTSSPAGITCPGTCSASFTNGTSITLTESASGGFSFVNWTGICSGASSTCNFTMGSSAVAETAAFSGPPPPSTSVTITGGVVITGGAVIK